MKENVNEYVVKLWHHIGKPIFNYLLRKITIGRLILEYFKTVVFINGGVLVISSFIAYYKGEPLFQFSFGQLETPVMIVVNISTTIVMVMAIILRIIEINKNKTNLSNNEDQYLEKKLSSLSSYEGEISQLLPVYKKAISNLHLQDAISALKKLREVICHRTSLDNKLLSNIDFLIAQCLRFRKFEDAIPKYKLAYVEMNKSNIFFVNIAAGYAYCLLKEGKNQEAYNVCKEILQRDPLNSIANTCKLANSGKIAETFNNLDNSLKKNHDFLSYAYPYLVGKDQDELLDIDSFSYNIPSTLEFDNIELWAFYISVSVTKLLRHEGYYFFGGSNHDSKYIKEVYSVTNRYLELSRKTDIEGVFTDIAVFHLYTKFFVKDNNQEERMRDIALMGKNNPSKDNRITYIQMYMEMLLYCNCEEKTVHLLEDNVGLKEEVNYFLWLVLAYKYQNAEYAKKGLDLLIDNNISVIEQHSVIAINTVITFSEMLDKRKVVKLKFTDESVQRVYNSCCDYYFLKKVDIENLKRLGKTCYNPLRFHVAEILAENGQIDTAIEIVKPFASTTQYSSNTGTYISLLKRKGLWKDLLHILKDLRHNGFDKIPDYLFLEFKLAQECNDTNDSNEVVLVLHKKFPTDKVILFHYASALFTQKKDKELCELIPIIKAFDSIKDENLIKSYTNLFFAAGKIKDGLDFLYKQMQYNHSLSLKDFLFVCSSSPTVGPYINNSKKLVEEGDFVYYEENGNGKSDLTFKNSAIEDFIGKKIGDSIFVNRFGEIHKATIKDIKNKFFAMLYNYTHSDEIRNSKNLHSVTIKELESYNGNLLDGILAFIDSNGHKKAKENFEDRYSKGEASFLSEFTLDNAFEGCFNRMFGSDLIYMIPYQCYDKINIEKFDFVIDLSSLLLLSALTIRFNLNFKRKFIIPKGLEQYIQKCIINEKLDIPSNIQENSFKAFGLEITSAQPYSLTILQYLEKWINENCTCKVAEDILLLNLQETGKECDPLFNLEAESMVLTINQPMAMLSEDWGLSKLMAENFKTMNVYTYLLKSGIGNSKSIAEFLADIHFAGSQVDDNYMFAQFEKKQLKQRNSFNSCLEGLRVNGFMYREGVNLARKIISKPIKLAADNFIATSVLTNVLESLTPNGREILVKDMFNKVPSDTVFMHCFIEAVKQSNTLIS